jgi:hypothetical protein
MNPNRLTDLLALSHVPRWAIVRHHGHQNVADHTFRVLVIYTELCRRLEIEIFVPGLLYALYHDAPESRTGDIPTPAKERIEVIGSEEDFVPWMIDIGYPDPDPVHEKLVQLADLIEAHTFIERHGHGDHSKRVAAALYAKMRQMADAKMWAVATTIIDEITYEAGR